MHKLFSLLWLVAVANAVLAADTTHVSVQNFNLSDSVKAVQFLAEFSVSSMISKKEAEIGIKTDLVSLSFEADRKEKEITFGFPEGAQILATGEEAEPENDEVEWKYDWNVNEKYKLLLSIAQDSASNFMLYSGYVFLPKENKWKLIATCKIQGRWNSIQKPSVFYTTGKKNKVNAVFSQAWVQRNTGSWKNMLDNKSSNPVINLASHLDSLTRHAAEISIIKAAIEKGLTETKENKDDVFYKIILQGTGQQVNITDTVTVFYKGTLFGTGEIFDQTRDKPATFPLNRLIRGWQISVPLCKVGATIKLVIPSALAYSIRTRASKIPPNSILVFEVEIVDMKAAN